MDGNALYAERFSSEEHAVLQAVRERTSDLYPGRAHMLSGAVQGQLLGMLVSMTGASRVLEVRVCVRVKEGEAGRGGGWGEVRETDR